MVFSFQISEWMPYCENETIKPLVGKKFRTLDDIGQIYTNYANLTGFNVRKASANEVE